MSEKLSEAGLKANVEYYRALYDKAYVEAQRTVHDYYRALNALRIANAQTTDCK